MNKGASSSDDRAFVPAASSPQAVSPVPASIPSAEYEPSTLEFSLSRTRLWVTGRAACREDLETFIAQLTRLLPFMPDVIAQAIEARRAETGTGSVHESAVRQDAPQPIDIHNTSGGQDV